MLGVWGGIKDRGKEIVLSVVIVAVPVFVSGVLPQGGFSGFVVCCVMMGLAVPFYNGPVTALMQERVAPEYLGRVFGLYGSVASLAMPIGLGLSGAFADRIGISNWFALSGILLICVAVLMFAIPAIRKIDKKKKMD